MAADSDNPEISDKIRRLREKYLASLPQRMAEIEREWQQLVPPVTNEANSLKQIYLQAHSLTGSAGTFGVEEISKAARDLADSLKTVMEQDGDLSRQQYDLIERQLASLKKAITD